MKFDSIIGQLDVKEKLVRFVKENRISHAYLFIGPEGNGKLALAIAYAQYISCINRQENDSCGVCPSCLKYEKMIHPDLHFIFPVADVLKKIKNSTSDDFLEIWRKCLLENSYMNQNRWYDAIEMENKQGLISKWESNEIIKKLSFKSFESEYKVMIIWLPEKMNQSSANKILKIIEEPPDKTVFLLVSENSELIIPTILSRTQILRIPGIEGELLWQNFQKKYSLENSQKDEFIHLAKGNYFKAREIVEDKNKNVEQFNFFVDLMRTSYARKIPEAVSLAEKFADMGREKQKSFFIYSLRMIRENFILNIMNNNQKEIVFLSNNENEFSKNFCKFIHPGNIDNINNELNLAYRHIEQNANPKIVFLDLSIKLNTILNT
ncbi:ATP-binding protein [Bacteroidota bacterium]